MVQRDRQDEAIGVIRRLLRGEERFDYECEWFTLRDAALQILPLQEDMPMAVASQVSPSGMTLAGKYGIGVISLGSMSTAGIQSLPLQWSFAEEAAEKHGATVNRADWRLLMSFHIAESRQEARAQARDGLQRWHNDYTVATLQRPGAVAYATPDEAVDELAFAEGSASVIGTPDDLVEAIRQLQELSGGFGAVIGFCHDWANPENTRRSWDLVARHVVPEINGHLRPMRASEAYIQTHRDSFKQATKAVVSKIMENERAAAALQETPNARASIPSHHAPKV
jgi:limonene 1,2-monooxygenase